MSYTNDDILMDDLLDALYYEKGREELYELLGDRYTQNEIERVIKIAIEDELITYYADVDSFLRIDLPSDKESINEYSPEENWYEDDIINSIDTLLLFNENGVYENDLINLLSERYNRGDILEVIEEHVKDESLYYMDTSNGRLFLFHSPRSKISHRDDEEIDEMVRDFKHMRR